MNRPSLFDTRPASTTLLSGVRVIEVSVLGVRFLLSVKPGRQGIRVARG